MSLRDYQVSRKTCKHLVWCMVEERCDVATDNCRTTTRFSKQRHFANHRKMRESYHHLFKKGGQAAFGP